jgi:glycosyl transferase family 25
MRGLTTTPIATVACPRLPCYVLTLDSPCGARYRSAAGQLARLPLDATFVRGVRLTDPAESPRYCRWQNMLFMKRPMTAGEVAVYLGHRRIWSRLLADGHDLALVLEDDFMIADEAHLVAALADALTIPIDWDIVKFFDFKPKVAMRRWQTPRTEFVTYKYPPCGCVAYLIRAAAAARLLDRRRIYRPIDEDWSHPWESSLRIISVFPNPFTEAATLLGGSLLESDRQAARDRHRSILRSLHGSLLSAAKNARARWWRRQCDAVFDEPSAPAREGPPEVRSKAA